MWPFKRSKKDEKIKALENRVRELDEYADKADHELKQRREKIHELSRKCETLEKSVDDIKFTDTQYLIGCDMLLSRYGHCRIIAIGEKAQLSFWHDGGDIVGLPVVVALYQCEVPGGRHELVLMPSEILCGIRAWQQGVAAKAVK